jgi:hypothetical protein
MKTTYDKLATVALIIAFIFALVATFEESSQSSKDPWVLPVIAAVLLSLNWPNNN